MDIACRRRRLCAETTRGKQNQESIEAEKAALQTASTT
jgi:hypothetical protein